jgi:hypothetical protein
MKVGNPIGKYIVAGAGAAVAAVATYFVVRKSVPTVLQKMGFPTTVGPTQPTPPQAVPEFVKVSALSQARPWPPVAGTPMEIRIFRPSQDKKFAETPARWWAWVYEVPYDLYVKFPREPRPDVGPDSFYYNKRPSTFYGTNIIWHTTWRDRYEDKVTEDFVDITATPRNPGWVLVIDAAWEMRRTVGIIPTTIWDIYACSGYGRIGGARIYQAEEIRMREPVLGKDYIYVPELDAYRCVYCGWEIYPPDEEAIRSHIRDKHPEKLVIG